ncbi:hypothetical protein BGX34_007164, partial [Mortierella sp. NVP85]
CDHRNAEQPIPPAISSQTITPPGQPVSSNSSTLISQDIFTENINPPAIAFSSAQADDRLDDIHQLAACLSLLRPSRSPDDVLEPAVRKCMEDKKNAGLTTIRLFGFVGILGGPVSTR